MNPLGRFTLAGAMLLSSAATAGAQERPTYWWLPTTLGYGAAGAAIGYSAVFIPQWLGVFSGSTTRYDARTFQRWAWGTAAVAGAAGFVIGRTTDIAIGDGRPLSAWQRRSAQFGTVFTGAAAGMYVSYRVTEARCTTCWQNPWRAAGLIALGPGTGGLIGYAVHHRAQRTLTQGASLTVAPAPDALSISLRIPR